MTVGDDAFAGTGAPARGVGATRRDPVNPLDQEARALVRRLAASRIGALGTLDPASGYPAVSRVTVLVPATGPDSSATRDADAEDAAKTAGNVAAENAGGDAGNVAARDAAPVILVSDLSHHTKALRADPRCSLLLGEPGPKGDPLTHPRVTLHSDAARVERGSPAHARLREAWLAAHPKAGLYVDFSDFAFWRLTPVRASLNGGFGKAYELTAAEWAAAVRGRPAD